MNFVSMKWIALGDNQEIHVADYFLQQTTIQTIVSWGHYDSTIIDFCFIGIYRWCDILIYFTDSNRNLGNVQVEIYYISYGTRFDFTPLVHIDLCGIIIYFFTNRSFILSISLVHNYVVTGRGRDGPSNKRVSKRGIVTTQDHIGSLYEGQAVIQVDAKVEMRNSLATEGRGYANRLWRGGMCRLWTRRT